jgi:hypothetical protein
MPPVTETDEQRILKIARDWTNRIRHFRHALAVFVLDEGEGYTIRTLVRGSDLQGSIRNAQTEFQMHMRNQPRRMVQFRIGTLEKDQTAESWRPVDPLYWHDFNR